MNNIYELYVVLLTTLIATIALVGLLIYYKSTKQKKNNSDLQRAELEMMRKSIENKIYDLNDRLLSNENRWLDVNHLLLTAQKNINISNEIGKKVRINNFLESLGITENDIVVDKKLIFVLTPFHPRYEESYNVIKEVCLKSGFKCMRGDEEYSPSTIFQQIIKYLVKARLVIANIDGRNPNVYYELGISQALDKPTILITSNLNEVPFDMQSQRFIVYQEFEDLKQNLLNTLTKVLIET